MILNEEQAGFRPNRSTQDVLLIAIDDWKKVLDLGQTVTTVMIEFSKVDSIHHNLVLRKLYAYMVQSWYGSQTTWQGGSRGCC